MIVDEMHEEHPELLKDQYWDEVVPKDLPYTVASEQYRKEEPKGSAEHYKVKDSDALYANVMLGTQIHSHVQHRKAHQDDMYADYVSIDNWCHFFLFLTFTLSSVPHFLLIYKISKICYGK